MPYIIDGHNLIPKIPGLSLQDIDDEMQLIIMLQEYCRLQNKQIEVFFNNATPGGIRTRNFGRVTASFVRQEITADMAIEGKLKRLEKAAKNYVVVSSDHAVINAARVSQARVMSSQNFANMLASTLNNTEKESEKKSETTLTEEDINEWLNIFGLEGEE